MIPISVLSTFPLVRRAAAAALLAVVTLGPRPAAADQATTGHHDHHTTAIPQTPAEIDAFVQAVRSLPETHAHDDDNAKAREHGAALDLVARAEATDIAVAPGDWFDPAIWHRGAIPGPGARVLIPQGTTVSYGGQSDVSIFTLRVDGELRFATGADTLLTLDTMVVSPTGRLEIGTGAAPVQPDVKARIVFANNGNIDVQWDPMLLSRGLVSHGQVEVYGAAKTPFLKVAKAPLRGDTGIELARAPDGWRVGDTIIVSGTRKRGWAWNNDLGRHMHHPTEDEVMTITGIDGNRITLDRPLQFHHTTPRPDLFAYVANMTRNVVFASQDGPTTPVPQRGHVMFMHNADVDVRFAAFNDLGRTDKSVEAADIGTFPKIMADSNIKGRYPFHFHKTGTADQQNPAMAVGNTVSGSPGWGFVHHSSHADFNDNVAFNVFGAAFAAEDGDETGIWLRNMAILSQGFDAGDAPAKTGVERHDNGRTGDGFFFAGRLVEAAGNVAINTTHGFVWMHRSAPTPALADTLDHPEIAYGASTLGPPDAPIQGFRNNEAFGTHVGLIVIKANPEQGHDVRSVLDGFLNWETHRGVDISYSGHYTLLNFDLIGTDGTDFFAPTAAVNFGTNTFEIVMNGLTIEGFPVGVDLAQGHTFDMPDRDVNIALIDAEMIGVATQINGFNAARHRLLTRADLTDVPLRFEPATARLRWNQDLPLAGTKIDAMGPVRREGPGDAQIVYRWEVPDLLRKTGYRTTADGGLVALVPDLLADRATGTLTKFSYVLALDMTQSDLEREGIANRGPYSPDDRAPVTTDDSARTSAGLPVAVDVLANDRDPEARAIALDGTTDPGNGEVVRHADGSLTYQPNPGFTGTDSFTYWAADDMGNYTPATVTVEVQRP